jgi:hypothetical protein
MSTCAQAECAIMCSVELVKRIITGQRKKPMIRAAPGQR